MQETKEIRITDEDVFLLTALGGICCMSEDLILQSKPPQAAQYPCWSYQYSDTDRECRTCAFNVSCKTAFSRRNNIPMASGIPYFQTPQQFQPPTQPTYQMPPYQPQQAPQPLRYEQQPAQPAAAQVPSGPFQVYPGETVAERLIKNIVLKVLEMLVWTVGNELARFFRGWTWPKTR